MHALIAQNYAPPLAAHPIRLSCTSQGVSAEQLRSLFRKFPGMEYCDLKTDRTTGKSKVGLGHLGGVGYDASLAWCELVAGTVNCELLVEGLARASRQLLDTPC